MDAGVPQTSAAQLTGSILALHAPVLLPIEFTSGPSGAVARPPHLNEDECPQRGIHVARVWFLPPRSRAAQSCCGRGRGAANTAYR